MVVFANIERILQENIFVFRIVFRCGFLIGVRIIDGSFQFHLFRQESTHIHLHSHVNIVVVVHATVLQTLIHRAKSGGFFMISEIDGSDIAQTQIGIHLCRPTAFLVEIGYAQFIHPNRTLFGVGRSVTHTHHHHAHITQRRVTQHRNHIVGVVGVRLRVSRIVGHIARTRHFLCIAIFLHIGEHI